jgi:hypothetical protein
VPRSDDPNYLSTRGRLAINSRLAQMTPEQRKHMADDARAAQPRKFLERVDPDHKLSEKERDRLVTYELARRMEAMRLAAIKAKAARVKAAEAARLDALAEFEADE